ncbi:hypothetical protein CC53_gp091 [Rhizobium phage vB_RleS_L338C]|uniref:hypothetical protein n=1 Tax=Rhizobium phage vB_RleS_L338C TaxID=1414737 RepID=UPI0003D7C08B|nr:hypothetical protein CC53_gp091 [Rhizobium phage vB_RleS_L338C]AHC30508.1 hypothetical protein L338C_091 [Rhizobium phage vB_RleS_L338C]QNH72150.1 hypothetical protein P11VFA_060 [Rhizobium phage P11VFA]
MLTKSQKIFYKQVGYYTTAGVGSALFVGMVIGGLFAILINLTSWNEVDATDKSASQRSGVRLVNDYGNGCQYLMSKEGHLTPRMGVDGKQICNGEKK